MEFNLKAGITGRQVITVTDADTASSFGSGLIAVFATPAMIALMEKTAQMSVQPLLPAGAITLGTAVSITHTKATPVGMKVFCESELLEIDGKKLLFRVIARDEKGVIGEGTHRRYIVDAEAFMNKLNNPA